VLGGRQAGSLPATQTASLGPAQAEARYVMDIYDGTEWTEMDIDDLKAAIEHGTPVEVAAQFLCRSGSVDDVERKAKELGLVPRRRKS
jgi:hypothetical protein